MRWGEMISAVCALATAILIGILWKKVDAQTCKPTVVITADELMPSLTPRPRRDTF